MTDSKPNDWEALLGKGAKPLDANLAEFWKPKKRGATLIGKFERHAVNTVGEHLVLSPVLMFSEKGAKAEGYGEYSVGYNTSLKKFIHKGMIGEVVGIIFLGMLPTPAGSMRTYKVVSIERGHFENLLREHAPALLNASPRTTVGDAAEVDVPEFAEGTDEDLDLPF